MNIVIEHPEDAKYKCDSGCSRCCSINVPIYAAEVPAIAEYTGMHFSRIAGTDNMGGFSLLHTTENRPCIFLENSRCRLYKMEIRPAVCQLFPLPIITDIGEDIRVEVDNCTRLSRQCIGLPKLQHDFDSSTLAALVGKLLRLAAAEDIAKRSREEEAWEIIQTAREAYQRLTVKDAAAFFESIDKTEIAWH